jgi:fatty-acyl-CoA synthase
MRGLMQDWPLLCHKVLDHAARQHPRRAVISYAGDDCSETNYVELRALALRVAQRLAAEGVQPGERVATVAANGSRHMAVWYGAMGMGAVYHPVNPRLFPDQLDYILNHAEDRLLFVDPAHVPLLESLAERIKAVRRCVVLTDSARMPRTQLPGAIDFESWVRQADGDFAWASVDENAAAGLFYTSGTTGPPKGVLYSHRSIVLLSLTANAPDMYGLCARDVVLMAVPMYHANGWSWPFTVPMAGASLILPGNRLDGASLCEIAQRHQATVSGGVPTVWQGYLDHTANTGARASSLRRLFIGGAPCPEVMLQAFERDHGIEVIHVWGMTEMGPTGSACVATPETAELTGDARVAWQQRQGRVPFLVEMKLADDAGQALPWDDQATGSLKVRGPCIVRRYYGAGDEPLLDDEDYFDTGDVGRIDANGFIRITDRSKDLIKSGGEWISSVDLENAALLHPAVQEAGAIAARHPRWDERPLLVVVLKAGAELTQAALAEHLTSRVPRWWLPDSVVFVEELPHTATGKIDKKRLREQYAGTLMPQQDNS